MESTKPKAKPLRRKKRRGSMTEPEKIIRAIQGVATAGAIAYRAIKPHLKKLNLKRKPKKGKTVTNEQIT